MSPTQPSNQSEQSKNERPSLSEVSARLLSSKEILELPVNQQGGVIIDRFIGSLVRQGEISGAEEDYSPADTLSLMDGLAFSGEAGLKTITRTNGLRAAVEQLALDDRIGKLFGSLGSRLETMINPQGNEEVTLTSAAQIEGYLLAGGDENRVKNPAGGIHMQGDSWIPVILEQVQNMSNDTYAQWLTKTQANELMKSSSPLIHNTGRDWSMASRSAESVGVDMDLIKRSAEKLQERTRGEHDLGATALFLATGGRIDGYQTDLRRRSY